MGTDCPAGPFGADRCSASHLAKRSERRIWIAPDAPLALLIEPRRRLACWLERRRVLVRSQIVGVVLGFPGGVPVQQEQNGAGLLAQGPQQLLSCSCDARLFGVSARWIAPWTFWVLRYRRYPLCVGLACRRSAARNCAAIALRPADARSCEA